MVIVRVADQDGVDGGQVLEADAGIGLARGTDEAGEGADAVGPDGVGENGDAVELDERGGVVDEGDVDAGLDAGRRARRRDGGRGAPGDGVGGELPVEDVGEGGLGARREVVEAGAVEVGGDGALVAGGA